MGYTLDPLPLHQRFNPLSCDMPEQQVLEDDPWESFSVQPDSLVGRDFRDEYNLTPPKLPLFLFHGHFPEPRKRPLIETRYQDESSETDNAPPNYNSSIYDPLEQPLFDGPTWSAESTESAAPTQEQTLSPKKKWAFRLAGALLILTDFYSKSQEHDNLLRLSALIEEFPHPSQFRIFKQLLTKESSLDVLEATAKIIVDWRRFNDFHRNAVVLSQRANVKKIRSIESCETGKVSRAKPVQLRSKTFIQQLSWDMAHNIVRYYGDEQARDLIFYQWHEDWLHLPEPHWRARYSYFRLWENYSVYVYSKFGTRHIGFSDDPSMEDDSVSCSVEHYRQFKDINTRASPVIMGPDCLVSLNLPGLFLPSAVRHTSYKVTEATSKQPNTEVNDLLNAAVWMPSELEIDLS